MTALDKELEICRAIARDGSRTESWLAKKAYPKLRELKRIESLHLTAPNICNIVTIESKKIQKVISFTQ